MGWLNKPGPTKTVVSEKQDEQQQLPTSPAADQQNGTTVSSPSKLKTPFGGNAPGLPPNVELRECKKEDIKSFKRLNSLLLPIPYADSFYREIMEDEVTSNITLMAVWHDSPANSAKDNGTLIGAIRCRLFSDLPGASSSIQTKDGPMLYLSTLVLLSPYRSHGIAARMLDVMVRRAVNDYGITSVGAHVWEANEEGLAWYRKRGFKEVGREEGYYRRLNPQGALVMMKSVGVMDLLED